MDRLISEKAVIDAICKVCAVEVKPSECRYSKGLFGGCKEYEAIKAIPSAERKTGHWIEHPEIKTSTPEYLMFYECSECGNKQCFYTADTHRRNYCGNCGAKMVEEQESEEV